MKTRRLLILSALLALIAPQLDAQSRRPSSCEQFQAAVAAEPNNLDAAARLGQCTIRDQQVVVTGPDSTHVQFRTNWAPALRALRHAVELNPAYTPAYRPLFRILLAEMRDGCTYETGYCLHVAPVLRDGDSVLTPGRLVVENDSVDTYKDVRNQWQTSSRANLEEARGIASRWAAVAPNDRQPHEYLGQSLLRLGDFPAAADELERAALLGTDASRRRLFWDRMEALVKSNRGADARRVLDETASDPARDTSQLRPYMVEGLNSLLGRNRPRPVDSAAIRRMRARRDSLLRNRPPLVFPPPPPSIDSLIANGDTAGAHRLLQGMASSLRTHIGGRLPRFYPHHLEIARYYLILADTTVAEDWLRKIDEPFHAAPFEFNAPLAYPGPPPWVARIWMMRGNVAAARGRRDEAAAMYRRVIGLWSGADGDVQFIVNDARVRLDTLVRR